MKPRRSYSQRELLLCTLLVIIACGLTWWAVRGKPGTRGLDAAGQELAQVSAELESARARFSKLGSEGLEQDSEEDLLADERRLAQELEQARSRLSELERRFAPRERIDDLNVALSDLAGRLGLETLESASWSEAEQGPSTLIRKLAGGELYRRPLQSHRLSSSYEALMQFVEALAELPYQVTVVRYDIEIASGPDVDPDRRLTSTLVLAL